MNKAIQEFGSDQINKHILIIQGNLRLNIKTRCNLPENETLRIPTSRAFVDLRFCFSAPTAPTQDLRKSEKAQRRALRILVELSSLQTSSKNFTMDGKKDASTVASRSMPCTMKVCSWGDLGGRQRFEIVSIILGTSSGLLSVSI